MIADGDRCSVTSRALVTIPLTLGSFEQVHEDDLEPAPSSVDRARPYCERRRGARSGPARFRLRTRRSVGGRWCLNGEAFSTHSAHRAECAPHLVDEDLRLLERGEVAAAVELARRSAGRGSTRSHQRRDGRMISRGNTETPTGTVTGSGCVGPAARTAGRSRPPSRCGPTTRRSRCASRR